VQNYEGTEDYEVKYGYIKFALPRVCRQIYHETATLIYSENTPDLRDEAVGFSPWKFRLLFMGEYLPVFKEWDARFSMWEGNRLPYQREAIRAVEMHVAFLVNFGTLADIRIAFPNLRILTLDTSDRGMLPSSARYIQKFLDKLKERLADREAGELEVSFV
jgi:hypothetical protein